VFTGKHFLSNRKSTKSGNKNAGMRQNAAMLRNAAKCGKTKRGNAVRRQKANPNHANRMF
jgi:hypothetical protein